MFVIKALRVVQGEQKSQVLIGAGDHDTPFPTRREAEACADRLREEAERSRSANELGSWHYTVVPA